MADSSDVYARAADAIFHPYTPETVARIKHDFTRAGLAIVDAGELEKLREALALIRDRTVDPVPTKMSDRRVLDWVNGKCRSALNPVAKGEQPDAPL